MAERSVLVRLQANIADFKAQMAAAERAVDGVGSKAKATAVDADTALGRLTQSAQKNRQEWDQAGTVLAGFGAVTVAALGATVKAAIDWESAWAGVTKTVSGTPAELQAVETGLRDLTRTMPAAHGEIAAVAEAAGQLGVQTGSIVGFTRTMIDLGETTNLSADQAATSLAQLMNVMQTAPDDVGRLGASLVALGNAGASTEADIVNMASYLTGSAQLIGASESDVLALANAMTSMGINAERGGGVMTRVMQDVYAAVATGGEKLDGFAELAGMSASEFARAFEEDPIRAIDAFVQGLNGVEASGGNVVAALGELGYKGTQDTAVLLQMAGAGDLLTESLDLGNEAWTQNTALLEEAAKRYDTTASKLEIARNGINDAAIEIGEVFLPVLAELAGSVASVAGWFADLPDSVQGAIGGLAGVTGVAALAGGAFLLLFPRVVDTVQAFRTLQTTSPGVAANLGRVGRAAGALGAAAVVLSAFNEQLRGVGPEPASMEATTSALINMGQSMEDIDALFRAQGSEKDNWGAYRIDGLRSAAEQLTDPSLTTRVSDFFSEISSFGRNDGNLARERTIVQFNQLGESLALMVQSGSADAAAASFEEIAAQAQAGGMSLENLRELMPAYVEALDAANTEQLLTQESGFRVSEVFDAIADAINRLGTTGYESLGAYAEALGMSDEATEKLRDRTNELGESLSSFIDPLGSYTGLLEEKRAAEQVSAQATADATESGSDSWEDYATDVSVSIGEYMTRLEEQLTAQSNWQTNMLILSGRVSQGTIDELARMGVEGAPLVAQLVNASDAEMDRLDVLFAARSQEATSAWGEQLFLAAPVLSQIAATAGTDVVASLAAQLQAGTTTVAAIAAQYGISLADGVNPVLASLGKPVIALRGGGGGRLPGQAVYNADGNVFGGRENHIAQHARAGAWRVWAEDETGGETYIPHARSKRDRSLAIWRETGKILDAPEMEFYAFGGIRDVPKPTSTRPFQAPLSSGADATMEKAYEDITSWLTANLEPISLGSSPSSSSGLGPRAMAAKGYTTDRWGITNIGGFARRNIFGTNTPSKHSLGKAIDVMTSQLGLGWEIANFFNGPGRSQFGVDNVIWQQSIAGRGGGAFRGMEDRGSATQNHRDHVHVDFLKDGGLLNPHVRDRGGPLLPGYTLNATGGPEWVVDPRQMFDASSTAAAPVVLQPVFNPEVRVFLGDRELTDMVRIEVRGQRAAARTGAVAASVAAGTFR